jgi:hypothetical protein
MLDSFLILNQLLDSDDDPDWIWCISAIQLHHLEGSLDGMTGRCGYLPRSYVESVKSIRILFINF